MRPRAIGTPLDVNVLCRTLPMLAGVDPGAAVTLVESARLRDLEAGATIFDEGQVATTLFVVIAGSVKLVQLTDDGEAVVFRWLGYGDVFGTVAILGDQSYPVSASAVTATTVLQWPAAVVRPFLEVHPRLSLNLLRSVSDRLQALRLQYRQLATEKVERRVARMLLKLIDRVGTKVADGVLVDLPLSREDVAQMTGTTVFSVSRIISRWEAAGFLRAGRQQVVVRRRDMLASIADDSG